jgi:cell wall assembly regulator SMI1
VVIFIGDSQPLTDVDLDDVEIRLGIDLPSDFRSRYLRHNGGKPIPSCFAHDGDFYCVDRFLAMKTGNKDIGFEETYEMLRGMPEFPEGYIPFAIDEAGDFFLYSIKPESSGQILFNQSDYIGDQDRFVVLLCSSLDQLINSLTDI